MLWIGLVVRVIVVLGLGGVGKSIICKVLYEYVLYFFIVVSYVEDVKEKFKYL